MSTEPSALPSAKRQELISLARSTDSKRLEARFLEELTASPLDVELFAEVGETLLRVRSDRQLTATLLQKALEQGGELMTPNQRVRLLRVIVAAQEKEPKHRTSLARALHEVHTDVRGVDAFIESCGITTDAPIRVALEHFERLLQHYVIGSYLLHKSGWGVGFVEDIDTFSRELVLTFEQSRRHPMPVMSALQILEPLHAEDWRVLKAFQLDRLREMCGSDPGEVVARVLRQYAKPVSVADFRAALEGKVVAPSEWAKWWPNARQEALKRSDVHHADGRGSKLVYRETSGSTLFDDMQTVLSAKQVLDLAEEYLRNHPPGPSSEKKTLDQFVHHLIEGSKKHASALEPAPLALLLHAHEISELIGTPTAEIEQLLAVQFQDPRSFYSRLPATNPPRLHKRAVDLLRKITGPAATEHLQSMLPFASGQFIETLAVELVDDGRIQELQNFIAEAIRQPQMLPELLVWVRRKLTTPRFAELLQNVDRKVVLDKCLTLGELKGKKPNPVLKALQRNVARELATNDAREFRAILRNLRLDEAKLLKQRIVGLRMIPDATKDILLAAFQSEHSELHKAPDTIEPHQDESVIYCTQPGIEKRKDEYEKLVNGDLPRIFEAIGKAASYGDLSENAEYTAALEERTTLTKKAEKMQEELRRVKTIDASLLREGSVTIGSRVRALNLDTNQEEQFTFLGPWDADYEHGILDYRAPLAQSFLGNGVGDEITCNVGGKARSYQILSVEPTL